MPDAIPLIARAEEHGARVALAQGDAQLTYADLLAASARMAGVLLDGRADLDGARVALLTAPGIAHVVAQWATWRAGGVCVPLCTAHPPPELAYVLDDAEATIAVCDATYEPVLRPLCVERGIRLVRADAQAPAPTSAALPALPRVPPERDALVIYTSGTTGKPKGAVTTHAILAAQIRSVVEAWSIDARDRIVHALPLHHLHGILNALCAMLWAGATCEMLPRFDADALWERLASGRVTLFMGVPTMYAKLTHTWDAAPELRRIAWSTGARALRLMVSGSAALPVAQLERWRAITGHTLLERYGMTELGMILGNLLGGERRAGTVGVPFPGVEVRLLDERGATVTSDGSPGEIQVRGPNVFAGYWRKPDATRASFTDDGWFRTGDIAVRDAGAYRILGRESVDILKTGGYKVSALEIEEALREHPAVAECAVVGVPDAEWGQRVAAALVLKADAQLDLDALRAWGKERIAPYKVPTLLRLVADLPRNALGKVQKPDVVKLFQTSA